MASNDLDLVNISDVTLYEVSLTQQQCPSVYKKLIDLTAENDILRTQVEIAKRIIETFSKNSLAEK